MDGVEDDWARVDGGVVVGLVLLDRVYLLLYVVLNDLYPLNNDVFKKPLSLFQGHI